MKACLNRPLVSQPAGVVITYDIIHVYKTLVLSCGVSLEGSCEDPKVYTHILKNNILQDKSSFIFVISFGCIFSLASNSEINMEVICWINCLFL